MLVVNRFRVLDDDAATFCDQLAALIASLAVLPGYVGAQSGRNLDETDLFVVVTHWQDTGSYRRALSAYDVKIAFAAIQHRLLDEPSAYEPVGPSAGALNVNVPR